MFPEAKRGVLIYWARAEKEQYNVGDLQLLGRS
jgi:hypothetical protein